MSAHFYVYTSETGERDDTKAKPFVFEWDEFPQALNCFTDATVNQEWAELIFSS